MMDAVREYLLSLVCTSMLTALVMTLMPKGSARRAAAIACALLLAITALRPLGGLDGETFSQALSRARMEAEFARTGVEVRNRELVAAIIKENSESYILDKASSIGLQLEAEVTVAGEDTYPYPAAVTITGYADAEKRRLLTQYIEENLAIAEDAQTWK